MSDQPPGTTKRVITILWSIGIAGVLIILTVGVLLPSTKRATIDFPDAENDTTVVTTRSTPEGDADSIGEATTRPTHIFGSKSGVFEMPTNTELPPVSPSTVPTP